MLPTLQMGFCEWLANELYRADRTAPTDNILNATINALIGQTRFDGEKTRLYARSKTETRIGLDLCM